MDDKKYNIIKNVVGTVGIFLMIHVIGKTGVGLGWSLLFAVGHTMTRIADYMRFRQIFVSKICLI